MIGSTYPQIIYLGVVELQCEKRSKVEIPCERGTIYHLHTTVPLQVRTVLMPTNQRKGAMLLDEVICVPLKFCNVNWSVLASTKQYSGQAGRISG